MLMIYILLMNLIPTIALPIPFNTLPNIVAYAESRPEDPPINVTDWHHPDYSSFHKKEMPTLKERVTRLLGFSKKKAFSVNEFKSLLNEITRHREQMYSRGRLIEKVIPKQDSSFIIWGEINGAFHSLVRSLQELKLQGLITDHLKLSNARTYLVFNGNVVDKSPYILETLTVILHLMKNNPRQVFYLKGKLEDKENWTTGEFSNELAIRAREYSQEKIPFTRLLRRFFGTLPLALYLIPPDQTENDKKIVRISYFAPDMIELDESNFPYFFDAYTEPVISILEKVSKTSDIHPTIQSYIYIEDRIKKYTPSRGLVLQSKGKEGTRWTTVSSPIASFRRLYEFFHDAFVILKTAQELSEWKLTLYNQDVRKLDGFKKDSSFYLVSGDQLIDETQLEIVKLTNQLNSIQERVQKLVDECIIDPEKKEVEGSS